MVRDPFCTGAQEDGKSVWCGDSLGCRPLGAGRRLCPSEQYPAQRPRRKTTYTRTREGGRLITHCTISLCSDT